MTTIYDKSISSADWTWMEMVHENSVIPTATQQISAYKQHNSALGAWCKVQSHLSPTLEWHVASYVGHIRTIPGTEILIYTDHHFILVMAIILDKKTVIN